LCSEPIGKSKRYDCMLMSNVEYKQLVNIPHEED
jgi:hypothetical protein